MRNPKSYSNRKGATRALCSTVETVSRGGQRGIRVRENLEHLIESRDFEN
jgi:hypothetical protein